MTEQVHIAEVSDRHLNSTVALCPPGVYKDDGELHQRSRTQCWLWECWVDYWQQFGKLPGKKIAIDNGDTGDLGKKHNSTQLISQNPADVLKIIKKANEPMLEAADQYIFIRGTEAHTGEASWIEEEIAADTIGAVPQQDGKEKIYSWYNFRGVIGGIRLDTAHHARMGGLPWTRPNSANQLAIRAMLFYGAELKQELPHYLVRSHMHRYADSGNNYPVKVIFTPCWTTFTGYTYRIGRELELADIGGIVMSNIDGVISDRLIRYSPKDVRQIWKLQI